MCGIAGFVGREVSQSVAAAELTAMCDAIQHRGPDSAGYFVDEGVALGMRRLSIIDVNGGDQPIFNEDRSIVVVFNGEIYNHHALRHEMRARGHKFATNSDTEVLVHLYEEFGTDMVSRLQGMFAFALWNKTTRQLLIARDRSGMKPLSYSLTSAGLIFGSELRSLWALRSGELTIRPQAVMRYLAFGYVPDPMTIFAEADKLPPGHLLTWDEKRGLAVRRYWHPPRPQPSNDSADDLQAQLRDKLEHAVESHLESEVPLGAFLSGGLDSSTVVALMARKARGRVKTFSIGFGEGEFNEADDARATADALGTDHTELIVRPNVESLFEGVAGLFDEPFGDPSAIPTFLVAALAREKVTVALSGDGGDELFGGYSRYTEQLRNRNSVLRRAASHFSSLARSLPHSLPGRNWLMNAGRDRFGQYLSTLVMGVRLDEGGIAAQRHQDSDVSISEQIDIRGYSDMHRDFASLMMLVDFQHYLPGDILTKVDRTSMAVSLEARVPFLDFDLVDFALAIPGHLRVTEANSKILFRRVIREIVPSFVLGRPKKGFSIPLGSWFRGPLRHRAEDLLRPSGRLSEFVDPSALRRIVTEHVNGRRDHSGAIWRAMVLDYWLTSLDDGRLGRKPSIPRFDLGLTARD